MQYVINLPKTEAVA